MEAGRLELTRRPTPVARLLHDAAEAAAATAEQARIGVHVRPPETELEVHADVNRLGQVLDNLVGNALKFTPPGGTVTLAAEAEGSKVRFAVTDTGPGIPEEHRQRIFHRFYQVNPADRRGVGLGLAIAHAIVEAHGGSMEVESEPGQGATFSFTVPAV